MPERWKCLLCGRQKFTHRSPHRCRGGFRKRRIKWLRLEPPIYPLPLVGCCSASIHPTSRPASPINQHNDEPLVVFAGPVC